LWRKLKEAEPVAIVTEATNITGATVSNEVEVEEKLDKLASQVYGICLQSLVTRMLTASTRFTEWLRRTIGAWLFTKTSVFAGCTSQRHALAGSSAR